jgi:PadR family transcriptional regulator PadR
MSVDTKIALLQVFVEGDSYGLAAIERVGKMTNGVVRLVQGRVYPALRELEAEGLLESYEGEPMPERGGRPRRYYHITAKGRRVAQSDARNIFSLLKVALGSSA